MPRQMNTNQSTSLPRGLDANAAGRDDNVKKVNRSVAVTHLEQAEGLWKRLKRRLASKNSFGKP